MAGRTGWRRSITNESGDRERVEVFLERSDEASFRSLYRAHTPALYRLALRILDGHCQDAEEVVQLTWIRAVEGLRSFRWQSTLRTWLAGFVVNGCREIRRRGFRERAATGSEPIEAAAPAVRRHAEEIDLERSVARLPEGCREVLVLHEIEGYTHEEIAAMLGIDAGTSKSQLSRARAALRSQWAGRSHPDSRNERSS